MIEYNKEKYLVPFAYKDRIEKAAAGLLGKKCGERGEQACWARKSVKEGANQFLPCINRMIKGAGEPEGRELACMELTSQAVKSLPSLTCDSGGKEIGISLSGAGLFLFGTGIGFLWLETVCSAGGEELAGEDLLRVNKLFKNVVYGDGRKNGLYVKGGGREKFSLPGLIHSLLEQINVGTFFLECRTSKHGLCPVKTICFAMAAVTRENPEYREEDKRFLFHLRKGFGPDENSEREVYEDDAELLPSFHHSIWGVCVEGCAGMVVQKELAQSFLATYDEKGWDYFYLLVLALHQYYAMLNLFERMSALPERVKDFHAGEFNCLHGCVEQLSCFELKYVHSRVSFTTHLDLFYDKLIGALGLNSMLQATEGKMRALECLIEENRRGKRERRFLYFSVLGGFFVLLESLDFFIRIDEAFGRYTGVNMPLGLFLFLGIAAVCLAGAGVWWLLRKILMFD